MSVRKLNRSPMGVGLLSRIFGAGGKKEIKDVIN